MNAIGIWYDNQQIVGIRRDGQIWLRVPQIVGPLGFRSEKGVFEVFRRHEDEFTLDETTMVPVITPGGVQKVRFFSIHGVRLLALLARTEQGKRFRRFLLDVLAGRARVSLHPGLWDTDHRPGTEAREVLDHLEALSDDPQRLIAEVRGLRDGTRSMPCDPIARSLIAELREIRSRSREAAREENSWRQRAGQMGYDADALARRARGRRQVKSDLLFVEGLADA